MTVSVSGTRGSHDLGVSLSIPRDLSPLVGWILSFPLLDPPYVIGVSSVFREGGGGAAPLLVILVTPGCKSPCPLSVMQCHMTRLLLSVPSKWKAPTEESGFRS